jgi:hypothetical protein
MNRKSICSGDACMSAPIPLTTVPARPALIPMAHPLGKKGVVYRCYQLVSRQTYSLCYTASTILLASEVPHAPHDPFAVSG